MKQKNTKNTTAGLVVSNLYDSYNSIGDAVIITDEDGNITRINQVAEKVTGRSLLHIRGKSISEVFHIYNPETGKKEEYPINTILKSKGALHFNNNAIFKSKDGTERIITGSFLPIRNTDNSTDGILLIFRDLTEHYKTKKEDQLLHKMEILSRLAGGIVHDFNNILTGISGCTELLLKRIGKNDTNSKLLDMILDATEEAYGLTHKILAFSQRSKMRSDPVDLHNCVNYVVHNLEWNNDCKINIRKDLKADMTTVIGDSSQIQKAIKNIVLNSRDAMQNGGELTLSTFNVMLDEKYAKKSAFKLNPGPYIELSVRDTGTGMSEDTRRNIFDPFFSTKKTGKSTGFGLAVVYRIVSGHHGSINVFSQVNKGTVFKIYLPVDKFTYVPN